MKKTLLFVALFLPSLCLGASYSIAIHNDPKVVKYYTGKPGPWLFTIKTKEPDTTVTCNGAPCPDQINEDQTITFTVTSPTIEHNLGFNIEFTTKPFLLAMNVCSHKETYWISSGETPALDSKMVIAAEEHPQNVLREDSSSDCTPYPYGELPAVKA
ncbi:MAG: hypothetical protein V4501_01990 [Pseudomonadota bacterium]